VGAALLFQKSLWVFTHNAQTHNMKGNMENESSVRHTTKKPHDERSSTSSASKTRNSRRIAHGAATRKMKRRHQKPGASIISTKPEQNQNKTHQKEERLRSLMGLTRKR
jgi:hypothetical protein